MAKEPNGNGKNPETGQDRGNDQMFPPALFFNHMVVRHSPEEIYFDIGQIIPGTELVGISHRFVTTVSHAKRILDALTQNLERYENRYGPISQPEPKGEKKKRSNKR